MKLALALVTISTLLLLMKEIACCCCQFDNFSSPVVNYNKVKGIDMTYDLLAPKCQGTYTPLHVILSLTIKK